MPRAVLGGSITSVAVVVDEDDLLQQHGGRGLQHAVDGPQQGRPGLVVEGDDDGGGGESAVVVLFAAAPGGASAGPRRERTKETEGRRNPIIGSEFGDKEARKRKRPQHNIQEEENTASPSPL